jgi:hypothetical protein
MPNLSTLEILIYSTSGDIVYDATHEELPLLLNITFGDYLRVYDTEYKVISRTWCLGTPILEITVSPSK